MHVSIWWCRLDYRTLVKMYCWNYSCSWLPNRLSISFAPMNNLVYIAFSYWLGRKQRLRATRTWKVLLNCLHFYWIKFIDWLSNYLHLLVLLRKFVRIGCREKRSTINANSRAQIKRFFIGHLIVDHSRWMAFAERICVSIHLLCVRANFAKAYNLGDMPVHMCLSVWLFKMLSRRSCDVEISRVKSD